MPHPILVTAAVIKRDGKILLTQRPTDGRHNGGRWEFPGGKVEFGEDPRICLAREIKEELGIIVEPREVFEYSSHVYGTEKHIVLLAFRCSFVSGMIQKTDIADFAWVAPKDFDLYDITEADRPFLAKLQQ